MGFFRPTRAKTYITIFLLIIFMLLFSADLSWLDCPFNPCSGKAGVLDFNLKLLTHPSKTATILVAFLVSYVISSALVFLITLVLKKMKKQKRVLK